MREERKLAPAIRLSALAVHFSVLAAAVSEVERKSSSVALQSITLAGFSVVAHYASMVFFKKLLPLCCHV